MLPQETDIREHLIADLGVEVSVICNTRWYVHLYIHRQCK